MAPTDVARAAEHEVRASYGRLMAVLSAQTHDLAAAEDALADALEQALRSWPEAVVPANPEGWLVTVARNRLRDYFGSAAHRTTAPGGDAVLPARVADDVLAAVERGDEIPDRRLELLFVCAHPAIDETVRTPLMLQMVLGFDAAQIASVFGVAPATMAQRLVRVKDRKSVV